ncbi:MAG: hypothetical protein ACLT0Y_03885 [Christensenellales bacterium]
MKNIGSKTYLQILDIPALAKLKDKDWYVRGMNWMKATILRRCRKTWWIQGLRLTRWCTETRRKQEKQEQRALTR